METVRTSEHAVSPDQSDIRTIRQVSPVCAEVALGPFNDDQLFTAT